MIFDPYTFKLKDYNACVSLVIEEDGTILFAYPCHEVFLRDYIEKKENIESYELYDDTDKYNSLNVMDYLCERSKCIALWKDFYIGIPNKAQKRSIQIMRRKGFLKDKVKRLES